MALTQLQPYMIDNTATLTIAGANITDITKLDISGGQANQALVSDGTGNISFQSVPTLGRAVAMAIVFGGA